MRSAGHLLQMEQMTTNENFKRKKNITRFSFNKRGTKTFKLLVFVRDLFKLGWAEKKLRNLYQLNLIFNLFFSKRACIIE